MLPADRSGMLHRSILEYQGIGQSGLEAFTDFVEQEIPRIIGSEEIQRSNGNRIRFISPVFRRPSRRVGNKVVPLLPREVRANEGHYLGELRVTVQELPPPSKKKGEQKVLNEVSDILVGKLPVMIGSKWDNLSWLNPEELAVAGESAIDPGGYFIIKGTEKVLIAQEQLRTKTPLIYYDKKLDREVVRYTGDSYRTMTVVQGSQEGEILTFTTSKLSNLKKTVNVFVLFFVLFRYALGEKQIPAGATEEELKREAIETIGMREDEKEEWRYTHHQFLRNTILGTAYRARNRVLSFITGKDSEERKRRARYYLQPTFANFTSMAVPGIFTDLRAKMPDIDKAARESEIIRELSFNMFVNVAEQSTSEIARASADTLAYIVSTYVDMKNGYREIDSRDNWGNKRVINSGRHMKNSFQKLWTKAIGLFRNSVQGSSSLSDSFATLANKFPWGTITEDLIKQFVSENWLGQKAGQKITNIVDPLHRESLLYHYYQLNTVTTNVSRQTTKKDIRHIQQNQWGYICPVTTPEGKACGIIRALTVTTRLSVNRNPGIIRALLKGHIIIQPEKEKNNPIILNGVPLGFGDARSLRDMLVQARREARIPGDTMIVLDENNHLLISCDAERLIRPLLVVNEKTAELVVDEKNLRNESIQEMIRNGAIEYIDVKEQLYLYVAEDEEALVNIRRMRANARMRYEETKDEKSYLKAMATQVPQYCNIDPASLLGVTAAIIPFIAFNQGPRIAFQSAMGRQALTVDSARMDLSHHDDIKQLQYADVGIVSTDIASIAGMDVYPRTQTAMIAYDLSGGGAQEDAIILNKESIERGLFRMHIFTSVKTEVKQSKSKTERVRYPTRLTAELLEACRHLDSNGIVRIGSYVKADDVLVAKESRDAKGATKNVFLRVPTTREGIVDDVVDTQTAESIRIIRIRIIQIKDPEVGDKFAMMPSQKGTVGVIKRGEDMPFISHPNPRFNGIRPDVIFSPLGIPSRMTMGKMLEIALGNLGVTLGTRIDASAFRPFNISDLTSSLLRNGMSPGGTFTMIEGEEGVMKKVQIFMGPGQYQVLRHLVSRKVRARDTGPKEQRTRQPVRGIKQGGGVRFGEMERDNLIAHGAAELIRERLMFSSDKYNIKYCAICGAIPHIDVIASKIKCPNCEKASFVETIVPYSSILLMHYLSAVGVRVGLKGKST